MLHGIQALLREWRVLLAEIVHNFLNRVRVEASIDELLMIACEPVELREWASDSWRDVIHNIRVVISVQEGTASCWVILCHFEVAIFLLLYACSVILNIFNVVVVSFANR